MIREPETLNCIEFDEFFARYNGSTGRGAIMVDFAKSRWIDAKKKKFRTSRAIPLRYLFPQA
jgi:hypothetical protein